MDAVIYSKGDEEYRASSYRLKQIITNGYSLYSRRNCQCNALPNNGPSASVPIVLQLLLRVMLFHEIFDKLDHLLVKTIERDNLLRGECFTPREADFIK
ncbi:hypothetical protein ACTXT7_010168 [Hymenolepis weldensis]